MTALDQAFLKAYRQPDVSVKTAPVAAVSPVAAAAPPVESGLESGHESNPEDSRPFDPMETAEKANEAKRDEVMAALENPHGKITVSGPVAEWPGAPVEKHQPANPETAKTEVSKTKTAKTGATKPETVKKETARKETKKPNPTEEKKQSEIKGPDELTLAPCSVKRSAKKPAAKKEKPKKKDAAAPTLDELELPAVVYRLDAACQTVPPKPLSPALATASLSGSEKKPLENKSGAASPKAGELSFENHAAANKITVSSAAEARGNRRDEAALASAAPAAASPMTAPPISTSPILAPPDALVSASADSPPSYSHAADPHLADHGGSNLGMTTFYQEASIRVFQPMLQVEHFSWPKACHGLEASAARELDRLTDALLGLLRQGMKVVGLGGRQPDEGATTLLLCLARRMVARNVKTVVVDADVFDPQVAKRLGLIPQLGWEDVAAGHQPVEEVLVESASDNLVVLPVCRPFDAAMLSGESRLRLADSLELLRNNYGLVLMDLGPLENSETIVNITRGKTGNMLDAAMLVQHVGKTSADHLAEVRQALSSSGVHVAGVIENFL